MGVDSLGFRDEMSSDSLGLVGSVVEIFSAPVSRSS